jgi:hypothetical protein
MGHFRHAVSQGEDHPSEAFLVAPDDPAVRQAHEVIVAELLRRHLLLGLIGEHKFERLAQVKVTIAGEDGPAPGALHHGKGPDFLEAPVMVASWTLHQATSSLHLAFQVLFEPLEGLDPVCRAHDAFFRTAHRSRFGQLRGQVGPVKFTCQVLFSILK